MVLAARLVRFSQSRNGKREIMATRAEMEHVVSKLKTDTKRLSWTVSGLPVVAVHIDKEASKASHLSQSLLRNAVGNVLIL